jgi:hypothetical protein
MQRRTVAVIAVLAILPTHAEAHFGKGRELARQIAAEKFPGACDAPIGGHVPMSGLAWATPRCRIVLADGWHRHGFPARCSALVHEYGHLAGFSHSENPASVMFAELTIFSPCERNAYTPRRRAH